MFVHMVGRHLAGNFAGGGASHAVRHHQQGPLGSQFVLAYLWKERGILVRQVSHQERVFIVLSLLADIRSSEDRDLYGVFLPSEETHGRCPPCRSVT